MWRMQGSGDQCDNLESVRLIILGAVAILSGCMSAPPPPRVAQIDPTQEAWYAETVNKLEEMNRRAQSLFEHGKPDEAAAIITAAGPSVKRKPLATFSTCTPEKSWAARGSRSTGRAAGSRR